ncbi:uncharacterized protein LOC143019482 [Oratosquilla oratoria]|uniref:uncharacterized protein LOC143019482 n=1 Tax=Oratosquilla oratoria TaxID=337810 RepID=UPI003F757C6B
MAKVMLRTLDGRPLEGWAKARTSRGIPYYVNHSHAVTQWDHPEYVHVMEELMLINSVKYAAYRTACKLRRLQTRLKLHEANLQCVASAFDNAGLRMAENRDYVPATRIEQVITDILQSTYRHRHIDIVLSTELALNLLLNIFDQDRHGDLVVLGCKVVLIVLCNGRLQEKYRYLFSQVADHNNCCTRRTLATLLRDLARIPELLSEQPSFGVSHVAAAVDSCFYKVDGEVGITEEVLLSWLLREPQNLVWWTTLYRLTASELVCHDVKCGVCKQHPIIGLRYQCLRCLGYNLCQDCFLHARTSKGHKLHHPIQEYCHEITGKEWRKAIVKIFKNKLGKNSGTKQRYLALPSNPSASSNLTSILCEDQICLDSSSEGEEEEELMSRTILHPDDSPQYNDGAQEEQEGGGPNPQGAGAEKLSQKSKEPTILPMSPRHQIHSVIMHLQEGQRQLEEDPDINNPNKSSNGAIQKHTQELEEQIVKLKAILKSYSGESHGSEVNKNVGTAMKNNFQRFTLPRLESTPILGERGLLLNISPITSSNNPADDTAVLENKENHKVENPEDKTGATPKHRNERHVLTPLATPNTHHRSHQDDGVVMHKVPKPPKLPSFTEINISDLTCLHSGSNSVSSKTDTPSENDDSINAEMKEELEDILRQLDDIFPLVNREDIVYRGGEVVEAALEVGDALANYVKLIPSQ